MVSGPRPGGNTWRRQGLPGSWGAPCTRALFSDPGGTPGPGRYGPTARPSAISTASAPTDSVLTRLNHTACVLAVYASQPTSPWSTQDSLPAAGQLCRAGVATRWAPVRGFVVFTSAPPRPGFAWRTKMSKPGTALEMRQVCPCRKGRVDRAVGRPAPHRSGRARFAHPAPRVKDSLRVGAPSGRPGATGAVCVEAWRGTKPTSCCGVATVD